MDGWMDEVFHAQMHDVNGSLSLDIEEVQPKAQPHADAAHSIMHIPIHTDPEDDGEV